MTLRSDSRSRARTRTGIRTAHRISPCYRHPDEPITGICASCLRERLSGLDASATPNVASPELRRCRSVVSISKCEASSSSLNEPRRKSCDVVSARNSLSSLFDVADLKSGSESEAKVESKNVGKNAGFSRVTYTVIESKKNNDDEIRVLSDKLGEVNLGCVDSDGEVEQGPLKTMKEYIDLEFQNKTKKSKDLREIAGSFLGAASVFTRKLRNWRQNNNNNNKIKNHKNSSNCKSIVDNDGNPKLFQGGGNHPDIVGRRSCDTEPRFSVDAGHISFEEPRASWDGYMIARTIPRLAPMLSVVENGILGSINNKFENHRLSVDGPMHSIIEDESSSGASGSGHSNSDSSSSMRRSSFDRSSSVRSFGKKLVSSEDHGVSAANVKLVITEKELKDWHLSSSRDDGLEKFGSISKNTSSIENVGNLNVPAKKSVRWRRIGNVFGLRPKNSENVCETLGVNVIDTFIDDAIEKQQGKENGGHLRDGRWKLARSGSVASSRNSCDVVESNYRSVDNAGGFGYAFKGIEDFKLERNTSAKYSSTADMDDGITPFYMTPLRSLRRSKSGNFKLQSSHLAAENVLRLN
ncbi:hypothetical protein DH2020_044135 [Rehmannia glutinosa]|uniref:Uncharacterized protein n=1 Tax=Rehmannia glutinosa TaxID=99300 RepID=A0ABR0UIW9_REHGL